MKQNLLWILLFIGLSACGKKKDESNLEQATEKVGLPYQLRLTLEHDPNAFTQGLIYYQDKLIESTGGDNSWIAEYDIESGKYHKKVALSENYFGEGITILNNKLYQLTWKNKVGFVYDVESFKKVGEFEYDYEGWGITNDGRYLIISDGTDKLHYLDTVNLTEVFTKSITHHSAKSYNLNELEFIDGYIFANQWESNNILKIDTGKSEVIKKYDFGFIANQNKSKNPNADVLNGIAYNPKTGDVYITGKLWPHLYVIRFNE